LVQSMGLVPGYLNEYTMYVYNYRAQLQTGMIFPYS
jgi:hypothetical protein